MGKLEVKNYLKFSSKKKGIHGLFSIQLPLSLQYAVRIVLKLKKQSVKIVKVSSSLNALAGVIYVLLKFSRK